MSQPFQVVERHLSQGRALVAAKRQKGFRISLHRAILAAWVSLSSLRSVHFCTNQWVTDYTSFGVPVDANVVSCGCKGGNTTCRRYGL